MRFFDKILKNRDAIAISMVFCSGPLNYALRDGLGLAPNSTIFSLLFMFGGIFVALPYRDFSKLYKNDTPLSFLALFYLFLTVAYMLIYVKKYLPLSIKLYDAVVIFIVVYFLFFLSTVKESAVRLNFLKFSILITFLGCIGLIGWVMMNPDYILGQRLAISFAGDSEMDGMGNPHIFGRGAFFGIISSLIYLKYETKTKNRLFTYVSLTIFITVLVLAQAMSAILAGFGAIALFIWHNNTIVSVSKQISRLLTKWYVWVFLVFFVFKGISFFNENQAIVDLGYRVIERRLEKLVNTFLPQEEDRIFGEKVEEDLSALGRVETMGMVKDALVENFEEGYYHKIFFGHGYYALYVDVPVIEVFHSYGLLGLAVFLVFFLTMFRYCWREMKKPTAVISEFAAYGFVYFFIFSFTNGLIMDYNRWTFFVLVCRFMPTAKKYITMKKLSKA